MTKQLVSNLLQRYLKLSKEYEDVASDLIELCLKLRRDVEKLEMLGKKEIKIEQTKTFEEYVNAVLTLNEADFKKFQKRITKL